MLRVQLLGEFVVERDGTAVALPIALARLLAYLAVQPGAHDRDAVAVLFWPDAPRTAARANLRTALWALRRALGDDAVLAARQTVSLGADVRVDVARLKLLAADDPGRVPDACAAELLPDAGEDWAVAAREEHRRWRIALLTGAGDLAAARGDLPAAARCSRLRCRLDPFDEPAHAELVRRLAAAGDRAGALVAGREFAEHLHAELGVRPGAAFRSAVAEVRAAGSPDQPVRRAATAPPLFGRGRELAAVMAAWSRARDGRGAVVLLTGEAGIGKSRLVAETAARAAGVGARVASGAGIDVGEPAPLTMWMDLARALARTVPEPPGGAIWPTELGRLAPELAGRLGRTAAPVPVASPELERLRIFDAVLGLVHWAAANGPVLLVAEDVHRADRASLALCGHIARRIGALPVLLVLTRRDRPASPGADGLLGDAAARGVEVAEVHLGALEPEDVGAIVRSVVPLPGDDVDRVVAAADGNPLLAVERARALAAGAGPSVPLRTAVRAALGGAPRDARDLLEALAVAARPLDRDEVHALGLGDPDIEDAAMDSGLLLHEGAGLRYRHSLLAEVVRTELPPGSHRHQQVALALESAAGPSADWAAAEVAGHLHRAGRDDLAGPRWRRAARHARRLGALEEAAAFWAQAIACDPDDPEPHLELAEVHAWCGRRAEYEREWAEAIARAAPRDRAAAWCRRGAVLRAVLCHPSAGLEAYDRARELLTDRDPPLLRARVFAGLAQLTAATDPDAVPALLDRAVLDGPDGDQELAVDRSSARLLWLIRMGRVDEVEREAEAGAAVLRDADRPDQAFAGLVTATCALAAAHRLPAALRTIERAVDLTVDVPVLALPCLAGRAHVLSRMDRHAEALESAREALAVATRLDSPELIGLARNDAGLVALAAGRHAEAAELLALALTSAARFSRPASRLARAEALARSGLADDAAAELRAAVLEPVGEGDQPWALVPRMARVQGLIALARGHRPEARRRLAEAAAGWRRIRPPDTGRELMASLVDLGRPPVVGLVDPGWELARVEAELAALPDEEEQCLASS